MTEFVKMELTVYPPNTANDSSRQYVVHARNNGQELNDYYIGIMTDEGFHPDSKSFDRCVTKKMTHAWINSIVYERELKKDEDATYLIRINVLAE